MATNQNRQLRVSNKNYAIIQHFKANYLSETGIALSTNDALTLILSYFDEQMKDMELDRFLELSS